ncbi:ribonuclease H-like domain-containing protein [Tanacetum coccineum]
MLMRLFIPVVKQGTIHTVFSLATFRHWSVYQLDVKNAFLHGDLFETVYMHQPPGYWDSQHPDYVCLLHRYLYGLSMPLELGFSILHLILLVLGFIIVAATHLCLSTNRGLAAYLLLYVDGIFLSQRKYASEILERVGMVNCNPSRTPVDTNSKLGYAGDLVSDPNIYRSLAGSQQYLIFTKLDISYAVQQVCLYMHDLREPHFSALKRIMRYVRGTLDYGLQLFSSTTTDLVAYSDAYWAGYPTTRSVANAVVETCWLRNLLREVHTPLSSATLVYCDNVSAVYLSCNPVQHQRTKHIEVDIHFVHDLVAAG